MLIVGDRAGAQRVRFLAPRGRGVVPREHSKIPRCPVSTGIRLGLIG